jgi:hypothetical protein
MMNAAAAQQDGPFDFIQVRRLPLNREMVYKQTIENHLLIILCMESEKEVRQ